LKLWEELEKPFNEGRGVEGHIIGKVKGGFKVDVGVPGISTGLSRRYSPEPQLGPF